MWLEALKPMSLPFAVGRSSSLLEIRLVPNRADVMALLLYNHMGIHASVFMCSDCTTQMYGKCLIHTVHLSTRINIQNYLQHYLQNYLPVSNHPWCQEGGSLREVSLMAIWMMEEPVGSLVRWSLTRGGGLWEVVAQGGSTVTVLLRYNGILVRVRTSFTLYLGGSKTYNVQCINVRLVWICLRP